MCGDSNSDEFGEFRAGSLGSKRPRDKLISNSLGEEAGDDADDDEEYGRNIELQPSPLFSICGLSELRMRYSCWCCSTHENPHSVVKRQKDSWLLAQSSTY